jgi:plasmid stabilization system protein ParE
MEYRVVLADSARTDAESLYQWVIERAPLRGPEWFEELMDSLYSLDRNPNRCPLAPEARGTRREIRTLVYGKRGRFYRVIFEVDEERRTVWILHIRRGARSAVRTEDLAEPGD